MKNALKFIASKIKNLLIFRVSSFRNFMIFTLTLLIVNFCVRVTIIKNFSDSFSLQLVSKIFLVLSLSSITSMLVFYIKTRYSNQIRKFVNANLVDLDRIQQNREKMEFIEKKAEKESGVDFRYKYLFFPLLWIFFVSMKFKDQLPLIWFIFLTCVLFNYWLYLRLLRTLIREVTVPSDMELKPSRFEVLKWKGVLYTWDWLFDTLGIKRASRAPLDERALNLSTARARNRYWRAVAATAFAASLVGGIHTLEEWVFIRNGITPPITRLTSRVMVGYTSNQLDIHNKAIELRSRGCDMSTFCYPGTTTFDPEAVFLAYDRMQHDLEQGRTAGFYSQRPTGPYNHDLPLVAATGPSEKDPFKAQPSGDLTKDFISDI